MSARIRRTVALVATLVALLATVLTGAATASAAPYTPAPSLGVDNANPCQHSPVTMSGVGYVPGSTETLSINGVVIGKAKADSTGRFTITVTLPESLVGTKTVTVVGPSGGRIASTDIVIKDCHNGDTDPGGNGQGGAGAHNGSGGGNGNGGLSSTGVAVLGLLVVAVALIGGGAVLVLGGRRRRAHGTVA